MHESCEALLAGGLGDAATGRGPDWEYVCHVYVSSACLLHFPSSLTHTIEKNCTSTRRDFFLTDLTWKRYRRTGHPTAVTKLEQSLEDYPNGPCGLLYETTETFTE